MFTDVADPQSARIVLTVAQVANTLECFDDLSITLAPAAHKHAEGVLKILGPAAVFVAILQAAPPLQESERVAGFVDVFVQAAVRRRQGLIDALSEEQRVAVLAHEATRSVPASRVIELFQQALADSSLPAWASQLAGSGEAPGMAARVAQARAEGTIGPSAEEVREAAIPREALAALGAAFAKAGIDEDALARVLDGVLPPDAPPGYRDDGAGTLRREQAKTGRNEPCPCGSGRKYKKCCGRG